MTGLDPVEVGRLSAAAERLTLLTRPSRTARLAQRYHPLVREFLEARLRSTISAEAVAELHRSVAASAAAFDWRVAAYHYRQAGDPDAVAATIAAAIPEIMGGGQHQTAIEEIDRIPEQARLPVLSLVTSRIEMQHRRYDPAIQQSNAILESVEPGSQESDYALLNLMGAYLQAGLGRESLGACPTIARNDIERAVEPYRGWHRPFGRCCRTMGISACLETHLEGDGRSPAGRPPALLRRDDVEPGARLASRLTSRGRAWPARTKPVSALEQTSSRLEFSAAMMAKGYSLTMLGRVEEGEAAIDSFGSR